jgi:ribonuclease D
MLANVSVEVEIPQENILNPDALRAICFEPPETISVEEITEALRKNYVRDWQIALVLEGLLNTLKANETVQDDTASDSSV